MKNHPGGKTKFPIRGFTVVELLVVIAIVIVLATLTFSLTRSAIESAKAANCMSNLRQVGTSIIMYATDNSGKLPPLQPPRNPRTGKRGDIWPPILARGGYMWDGEGDLPCGEGVWTCPSTDFVAKTYGGFGVVEDAVFVYGELFPEGEEVESGSLRLSKIASPADTWLVGDAAISPEKLEKGWYAIWSDPGRWDTHCPGVRHKGKANVFMADGHAETLTLEEIKERNLTKNAVR